MKKIVVLFLLVFFLIPVSDTIYAEDSQTTELIQQAIDKRKEFGLSTDVSVVTTLVNDHTISKEYGVYMSQEEEEKFTRRLEELDRVIEEIRRYVNANPAMKDNYLGLYIDQASGGDIYVGFRKSDSVNFNHKLASFKDNFHTELSIHTYEATYSEKEFEDIAQKISDNIHKLVEEIPELTLVNPDFINQKIEIGILDKQIDEVKVLNVLSELTGMKQNVFEIKVLDHTDQAVDNARNSTTRPLEGGLTIDNAPSTGGNCSIAYSAIDSNSNPYIITADHCWYKTSGMGIYQGSGYIGYKSSIGHYGNSVDAAGIRVTSNNLLSNRVYAGIPLTRLEVAGNDTLGDVVCMSGRNRGAVNSCGTLQAKQLSRFWGDDNVWFDNLRAATYTSTGGDSGGTVFRGEQLKGVNKGYYTTNGVTYGVYSHVTHVTNRLGLTPVTW